jgi:hypothetical protein
MAKFMGVDMSGLVAKHIGARLGAVTLVKLSTGARAPGSYTSGPAITRTSYIGKGFVEDYADNRIDGTLIKQGDRKIMLITDTFTPGIIPSINDEIIVGSETYKIVGAVKRDPATASYSCQCRLV